MNDFEVKDLAEQVEGLHQVVEALLEHSDLHLCCCSSKDPDDGEEGG